MKKIIIVASILLLLSGTMFLLDQEDISNNGKVNKKNEKTFVGNERKNTTIKTSISSENNQNTTNIFKSHELENYKSQYHLPHYEYYSYVKVSQDNILNLKEGDLFTINLPTNEKRQIKITRATKEPSWADPNRIYYRFLGEPLNKKAQHYNFKITGGESEIAGKYHFTMKLKIDSGVYIMKSEGENGFLFKNQLDRERSDIVDTGEKPLTDKEADEIHNSEEFKQFYEENKDLIEEEKKEYKEWQEKFKQ